MKQLILTFDGQSSLPYAHYQWTKQVIFESDVECPEEQKNKLLDRFLQIKNDQK